MGEEHLDLLASRLADTISKMIFAPGFSANLLTDATADQTHFADMVLSKMRKSAALPQLIELVERITVTPGEMVLRLCPQAVGDAIDLGCDEISDNALVTSVPFQLRKRGVETKIILADVRGEVDEVLVRNVARAHVWFERIKAGETFAQIAAAEATSKRRIQQMIGLAFLAPDIVRDVLDGNQPVGFTLDWCLRHDIPSDWSEQRALINTL